MHFNSRNELTSRGYVTKGDTIDISWKDKRYRLSVSATYVMVGDYHASGILNEMAEIAGETIYTIMSKIYGYETRGGGWPEYRRDDYTAAYKGILWVMGMCNSGVVSPEPSTETNSYCIGDVVSYRFGFLSGLTGIVMMTKGDSVTIAWADGITNVKGYKDIELRSSIAPKKDISKTKQIYNEHLQKQDLPGQGGERTTGNFGSGGGLEHSVGRGHRGYEAYFEDSYPKIRSNKISGASVKF